MEIIEPLVMGSWAIESGIHLGSVAGFGGLLGILLTTLVTVLLARDSRSAACA